MSIIHDALKKVQYRLEKKQPAAPAREAPPAPPQPRPAAERSKPVSPHPVETIRSNKMALVLLYVILISIGVLLILVFKLTDQNQPVPVAVSSAPVRVAVAQAKPAAAARVQQPVRTVTPAPQPVASVTPAAESSPVRDPSVLELGGTMLMGSERVALINDDIYEVGSTVDGKKVTEILLAEVKLVDEKDGSVTTLKVKNRR